MTMQEKIDSIMDNFDFAKVAKVMRFLNWMWGVHGEIDRYEIPDEPMLRKCARQLLNDVANSGGQLWFLGTGGFRAYRDEETIELTFNVTTYCEELL